MQKEVLIIIPAYNEEKNISKVLDRLEQPEIAEFADILLRITPTGSSKQDTMPLSRMYLTSATAVPYSSVISMQSAVITATSFRWMRTDSTMPII